MSSSPRHYAEPRGSDSLDPTAPLEAARSAIEQTLDLKPRHTGADPFVRVMIAAPETQTPNLEKDFLTPARRLRRDGKIDDAIALLEKGLTVFPDNKRIFDLQADLCISGNRHGEAYGFLKKVAALEKGSLPAPLLQRLTEATRQIGLRDEMTDYARQLLALDPKNAMAHAALFQMSPKDALSRHDALVTAGDLPAAISFLKNALLYHKKQERILEQLLLDSALLADAGEVDYYIQSLRRINPRNLFACTAARITATGETADLASALERLRPLPVPSNKIPLPRPPSAISHWLPEDLKSGVLYPVNALFAEHKFAEALVILEGILPLHPENPFVLDKLSHAYHMTKNFKKAAEFAERSLSLFPFQFGPLMTLAKIALLTDDYPKATTLLRKILDFNADDAYAADLLAKIIIRSGGDLNDAQALMERVLRNNPRSKRAMAIMERICRERQDLRTANQWHNRIEEITRKR